MSKDLIAIIGVGASLAGLILHSQHNLRADILDLRQETRAEFKAVRSEIQDLRSETQAEFKAVRSEMKAEFKAVRSEMKTEFKAVRSEMRAEFNTHLGAINMLREDVNQLQGRAARQEGLLEGLRDAITGSRELVAGPG